MSVTPFQRGNESASASRRAMLSSRAARADLGHHGERFEGLFKTIDRLGSLHDGLTEVRENADPLRTVESNALSYRKAYTAATAKARELIQRQVEYLAGYQANIEAAAYDKAGLNQVPAEAAEIRGALRQMTRKQRDAEVLRAIDAGDGRVLASIAGVPAILTGEFTTPVEAMVTTHIESMVPELRDELDAIDSALNHASIAASAFKRAADEMRDPASERRAEEGAKAANEAEKMLKAALSGEAADDVA